MLFRSPRFALQDALANIEAGAAAFTFASGMAAIHTLLLTLKPGDLVVSGNDLYGGTHRLFNRIEERFGIRVASSFDSRSRVSVEALICLTST